MKKKNDYIWMPLIGFDRDKEDKGVAEYLQKAGFIPEGISVFIFHPDIVNQHEGMEREYQLSSDCCSYFGSPRNEFRERQDWTNYDLRTLAGELARVGIDAYLGIDGVYLNNTRHYEWETDYPELFSFGKNGRMNLNVLKRFKDGTYYEDFFAEKATKAILDYGFAGLHVADFFCPPEHSICNGDFSTDLIDQFISYTKITLPDDITARLGFDEQSDIDIRADYIWENLRREWIDFYVWRWEKFWSKISRALHKNGKKVMINNAWCADPFEAIYRYGIDYKRLYRAGVDVFVAETVSDGLEYLDGIGDVFRRFMTMAQLMKAYSPNDKLLTLLGVKDCTEEWDILHHKPLRLERIMYTLGSLYLASERLKHSSDGYMVTLGDGITEDEWKWIGERTDIAFSEIPKKIIAPTVIWSDYANEAMLDEYIKTRRPTLHKLMYEIQNRGTALGAVARTEDIESVSGTLFVPNFDLLSEEEKNSILSYDRGAVVCIAPAGYRESAKIKCDISYIDEYASYKLEVFAFNLDNIPGIADIQPDEKIPETEEEVKNWRDAAFFLDPMIFRTVSESFFCAVCRILSACEPLFVSDGFVLPLLLENGIYRLYVFNKKDLYKRIEIRTARGIKSVASKSKYPIMPVKYISDTKPTGPKLDGAKAESIRIGEVFNGIPYGFVGKVPPEGVSIFDVELFNN
ncbi:MAG: hypothetical protein E7612_06295 [Ruminococcaceae bacterium]|nr:hypothetical protein [Oscillospiraceae bacterium]